jgi:TolB-like protein/class 3 adenylate cyclase
MSERERAKLRLEIAHVLFIDIVGYSKLPINEQSEQLHRLREIVRGTEQFRIAEGEGKLLRLPTGDGGALVFRNDPEAPVLCALEIANALKNNPELRVRMGIHSGPVNEVTDLNEQANIAGAGINIAQRIMDCGDAGHILLSKHVAEDLEHYPRWQSCLHELGECEVKHGARVGLVNFYDREIGNSQVPKKLLVVKRKRVRLLVGTALVLLLLAVAAAFVLLQKKPTGSTSVLSDRSIAVLPFENLSDDKSNAYFADGIQDEILTRLSKIAALKVISRTSTQRYKSRPDNLREIGKQLGVSNLLEGSVQKAGDSVRINVQLIQADNDSHLWAETFDRKLDNIFGMESEVATAIAGSLQAKLTGSEQRALAMQETDNVAAYDAYLRGLALAAAGNAEDNWRPAVAAYAEAVRIDPRFALAWANLASRRSTLYFFGDDIAENTADAIKEAADTALRLQPDLGEAWVAQGDYRYHVLRDFPGALQAFDEARKRLPNDAQVLVARARVLLRMGRWEEARSNLERATELDPRNLSLLGQRASFLQEMRRFAEARAVLDQALLVAPRGNTLFIAEKADTYLSEGRFDAGAKLVDPLPLDPKDAPVYWAKVALLWVQGRFDVAIAAWQARLPNPGTPLTGQQTRLAVRLGYAQLSVGHATAARPLFERVIQALKPTPTSAVRIDDTGLPMVLASAYAGITEKQAALDQARQAIGLYNDDAVRRPAAEATLAQVQAWFGDTDAAMAALPHLLQVPSGVMPGDLQMDPRWDPLRKDPRFQKLIADGEAAAQAQATP